MGVSRQLRVDAQSNLSWMFFCRTAMTQIENGTRDEMQHITCRLIQFRVGLIASDFGPQVRLDTAGLRHSMVRGQVQGMTVKLL